MSQTIGQKVKTLRKSRNLSQKDIGKMISMSYQSICYKEKHDTFTSEEVQIICKTLGYPYEVLISDLPFNPMQITFDRKDTLTLRSPEPEIAIFSDSSPVYVTDKEAAFLKRYRNLTLEQQKILLNSLTKLENGEQ